MQLEQEEFAAIAEGLEGFNSLFYKLWDIGRPQWCDTIPTAGVGFDEDGEYISFLFNKEFWDKCTPYERLFVVAHECLHVFLNHGIRTKDGDDHQVCNSALDVVVNETLLSGFGFQRDRISFADDLCFRDTVFTKQGIHADPNESFEYYYNLLSQNTTYIKLNVVVLGSGEDGGPSVLDDHSKFIGKDLSDIAAEAAGTLDDKEKEELRKAIESQLNTPAGKAALGNLSLTKPLSHKKSLKWKEVVRKQFLRAEGGPEEQWGMRSRRQNMLPSDAILPSERDNDGLFRRTEVCLFLDNSGSCASLKDQFFTAALSLPSNEFRVRAFSFDTNVYEIDLKSLKIRGGGGTAFAPIEHTLLKIEGATGRYPQLVFVITDGYGTQVNPKHPKRWHWFLQDERQKDNVLKHYAPKECHAHILKDFLPRGL